MNGLQLQLFDAGHSPRPKIFDENNLEITLDSILPKVMTWLRKNRDDMSTVEEVRRVLADAIEFEDDSRRIVNYLADHYCWDVNRELQSIMDCVADARRSAHKDLTNKWVLHNGITPRYSAGQRVNFKKDGKTIEGEVLKVLEETAEYLIFCNSLGHVRTGTGTRGIYVKQEDLQGVEKVDVPYERKS